MEYRESQKLLAATCTKDIKGKGEDTFYDVGGVAILFSHQQLTFNSISTS